MANPLFQQLFGGGMPGPAMPSPAPVRMKPMQKMMEVMRAMSNPAAFVKERFPDIPDSIRYDPNQVFNYLQRTRNPVSEQQIQEAQQMTGQILGQGTVK